MPYLFAAAGKLAALRTATARQGDPPPDSPAAKLVKGLTEAARWVDESRQVARRLMDGIRFPPQAVDDPLRAAAVFLSDVLDLASMPDPPAIVWPWTKPPADHQPTGKDSPAKDLETCYTMANGFAASGVDHREAAPSPVAGVLPPESAIAVYRLTTEAVRNAVRHSGANRIEISVDRSEDEITIRIQDDGCGFAPSAISSNHQHGLALSAQRAAMAGIQWSIESSGDGQSSGNGQASSDPPSDLNPGTRITLKIQQ